MSIGYTSSSQSTGTTNNNKDVVTNQAVLARSTSKSYSVGGTRAVKATGIDAKTTDTFKGKPPLTEPKPSREPSR